MRLARSQTMTDDRDTVTTDERSADTSMVFTRLLCEGPSVMRSRLPSVQTITTVPSPVPTKPVCRSANVTQLGLLSSLTDQSHTTDAFLPFLRWPLANSSEGGSSVHS